MSHHKERLEVLDALEMLWDKHPEQRLGQLLLNLTRNDDGSVDRYRLWNMEADELADSAIDAYLNGMR